MRYILLRYVSEETSWKVVFVLKSVFDGRLVQTPPGDILVFETFDAVRAWLRDKALPGASLEWEGMTTF